MHQKLKFCCDDYACEVLWDQHVSDFHFTLRSWQRVVDHFATGWHSARISSTHGQPYPCLYRQRKLLSMLNYRYLLAPSSGGTTTVFHLCSNYFSGIWWLLDKWVLLYFFNRHLFLSAFFVCTDLPSSGAVCCHSLICASISASVALGKAYHYTVYIIIIACSSPHLNWLISHKLWDQNVSNLHFV